MSDTGTLIALGTLVFLIAGSIKGLAGIGLPTASIGMLTLFVSPRVAIAVVLFPMIISNAWQVWRAGDIAGAVRRYGLFGVVLIIGVFATTLVTAEASDRVILGVTGVVILIFVVVNFAVRLPRLPDRYDVPAQVGLGAVAGVMGGLTGVWATPMLIYLTGKQVLKDEMVRATGLLIFAGSLPLCLGYLQQGFLTGQLAGVSVLMVVPTLAGFAVGERLRNRLPQEQFRTVFLLVFGALGLNLIRKAAWGS